MVWRLGGFLKQPRVQTSNPSKFRPFSHGIILLTCFYQYALRRRFTNTLRWYHALLDVTEIYVQDLLQGARVLMRSLPEQPRSRPESPLPPSSPPAPSSPVTASPRSSFPPSPSSRSSPLPEQSDAPQTHTPVAQEPADALPEPLTHPSQYLRRRCMLCFGGEVAHDEHFQ